MFSIIMMMCCSIASLKSEITELKHVNARFESQRSDLTGRLQALMTSHCSQALQLLHSGSTAADVVSCCQLILYDYVSLSLKESSSKQLNFIRDDLCCDTERGCCVCRRMQRLTPCTARHQRGRKHQQYRTPPPPPQCRPAL